MLWNITKSDSLMKRFFLYLLTILFFSVSIAGCSSSTREDDAPGEWNSRSILLQGGVSPSGYYYFQSSPTTMSGAYLSFFDETSHKTAVLCDKAGCPHIDEACRAYTGFAAPYLFYTNGNVFTIENSGYELTLVRRDPDGSNREEVLTLLRDRMDTAKYAQFYNYKVAGNSLYYIASLSYAVSEKPGDALEHEEYYLRRVSLTTFQEQELMQAAPNTTYTFIAANEQQVLLNAFTYPEEEPQELTDLNEEELRSLLENRKVQILLWDKHDGSVKTLLKSNRCETVAGMAAHGDSLYVLRWEDNRTTNSIQKISLTNGEATTIFRSNKMISNYMVLNEEEIVLREDYDLNLYSLKDFQKLPMPPISLPDSIEQATKDGYILWRTLKTKGDDPLNSEVTQSALSYISKEDVENGKENFLDFYIQHYE